MPDGKRAGQRWHSGTVPAAAPRVDDDLDRYCGRILDKLMAPLVR
ncbi:MAG TPA: hypothetical protein VI011_09140 [Asanoa sp.]